MTAPAWPGLRFTGRLVLIGYPFEQPMVLRITDVEVDGSGYAADDQGKPIVTWFWGPQDPP